MHVEPLTRGVFCVLQIWGNGLKYHLTWLEGFLSPGHHKSFSSLRLCSLEWNLRFSWNGIAFEVHKLLSTSLLTSFLPLPLFDFQSPNLLFLFSGNELRFDYLSGAIVFSLNI